MEQVHLTEEQALEYSEEELSPDEEARLDEHIFLCAECREKIEQADEFRKAMRSAASELRRTTRVAAIAEH